MADAEEKKYAHGSGPRHYYKSGWCTKHGHGHFGGKVGPLTSLKSNKRWLQLRHYVIYYYEKEQSGYNSWVRPPFAPPHPLSPLVQRAQVVSTNALLLHCYAGVARERRGAA